MDKKNSHSRQSFSNALSSENRSKTSDAKQFWPRNARRRENTNLSNTKVDPQQRNTKFTSSKTRPNFDKRPKPRNGFGLNSSNNNKPNVQSGTNVANDVAVTSSTRLAENDEDASDNDDDDNEQLDNFEIELNSVYSQGSKKKNLNHLLNFHYGPRESENSNGHKLSSNRMGNKYNTTKKHRYNKEQFLQANFQFVINYKAKSYISDFCPDTLIDWSYIEQINIQTTEEPQCPICLYPPVAAKLTRCGHVYCWPCILHYLALSDRTWRKCPICYDAIQINDLKSIVIVQLENLMVGKSIKLQLMQREKSSMFIEKYNNKEADMKTPYVSAEFHKKRFAKFLLARPHEILSIIEREKCELLFGLDENCPEYVFIQQALDLLKERKCKLDKISNEIDKFCEMKVNNSENKDEIQENDELTKIEDLIEEASGGDEEDDKNKTKENSKYYFYQSVDGQNIFLHPLNVKMLQSMYGSLDNGPSTIEAMIIQKEIQSMDEDLRKKFTCLGHLPLTCQFEIVEVKLEPPIISEKILNMFKDDIAARKKNRMRRAREEWKRERHINEINERQLGKFINHSANIDIKSPEQFPSCGYEPFPASGSSFNSCDLNLASSPILPMAEIPSKETTKFNYTSFANVLSSTSSKKDIWPSLDGLSTTATTAANNSSPSSWSLHRNVERFSEDKGVEDFCLDNRQNLGDVIADALLNTKLESDSNGGGGQNIATVDKKKKKKNKKMLLFSTGMNFNGN